MLENALEFFVWLRGKSITAYVANQGLLKKKHTDPDPDPNPHSTQAGGWPNRTVKLLAIF